MIRFLLMMNKQGQTRLAQYYGFKPLEERITIENELIRRCLSRTEDQCNFIEYKQYKIVYRRYASLYFIIGIDQGTVNNSSLALAYTVYECKIPRVTRNSVSASRLQTLNAQHYLFYMFKPSKMIHFSKDPNELAILELIHAIVEILDKCFENVCELDIMFNLEKAHFIINEIISDGCIVSTNKGEILEPIEVLEKAA